MNSEINDKIKLSSELNNIALIRAAEQAKQEALANAWKTVAEKLAAAAQEAEKLKEQLVGDARTERKRIVQQAVDQAKIDVKVNVAEQERASAEMLKRGEKWVGSAADFAVKYILGAGQENAE